MKKKIGFFINHGVEVRHFILSGIAAQLIDKGHDCIILKRPEVKSKPLDEYLQVHNLKVLDFPTDYNIPKRSDLENRFSSIRRSRLRVKGIGNFHNFSENLTRPEGYKDNIKALLYPFLKPFVLNQVKKRYKSTILRQFFQENQFTDICLLDYTSPELIMAAINAEKIKIWLFINTWKTVYINDFIPFTPNGIFLWSERMQQDYLICNKHIHQNRFHPLGNPAFDRFHKHEPTNSEAYYREKYQIPKGLPILVYTTIFKGMYPGEGQVIQLILLELEKNFPEQERPILLIRRNPFEENGDLDGWPKVRFAYHGWERDSSKNWSIQTIEGEQEWLDLLFYAKLNINIASLVSIEALMLGTPVLNIGFGADGKEHPTPMRFANSPYYQFLANLPDVVLAKEIEELVPSLKRFLSKTPKHLELPSIIGDARRTSANDIADVIHNS